MKSKLRTSAGILLFLAVSLTSSLAQNPGAPAQIDPVTGLPVVTAPDWKDPEWREPDITLTNVVFNGLPIAEVARYMSENFHGEFDIVLPKNWGSVVRDLAT